MFLISSANLQLYFSAIITLGIAYKMVPVLIRIAYLKDLHDPPDGKRKLHRHYISSLGGVAIYLAFITGFSLSGYAEYLAGFSYFSAALFILFFTGLKDDLIGLSPRMKLIIEILAAFLIIFGCDLMIDNFYGVLGISNLPAPLAILISVFTIVVVMNAYNLIDGVDGLAGGIGAGASFFFAIGFWVSGYFAMSVLSVITLVALLGYLYHNFNPASIFMGDSGSLTVGLLLSFQAIQFISLGSEAAFTQYFSKATAVILPVSVLSVPLYDTIRVFIKRKAAGRSPFNPGRDHVHHELLEIGFSQKWVALILYLNTLLIGLLGWVLAEWINVNLALLAVITVSALLMPTAGLKRYICRQLGLFDIELYFSRKKASTEKQKDHAYRPVKDYESVIAE